jgi:nucleoside-diphosphate-sugar epimerase
VSRPGGSSLGRATSGRHGLGVRHASPRGRRTPSGRVGFSALAAGSAFGGTPLDNYVDARDVAQLIRLAVEAAARGTVTGAAVFHAAAADSPAGRPLGEAVAAWRPEWAGLAAGLDPEVRGISIAAARRELGYAPRYRSRDLLQGSPA